MAESTLSRRTGWLVLDLVAVLFFVSRGRLEHDSAGELLDTAWPFLTALVLGWAITRAWRSPVALWPTGVGVWATTLVVAMLLRWATGAGTAPTFVLVTAGLLAAVMLGWRLLGALFGWLSRSRPGSSRARPM